MGKKEGIMLDGPGKVEQKMDRGKLLEVELMDDEGNPMPNTNYTIIFAGGKEITGVTDEKGIAKHYDLPDEDYEIVVEEPETDSEST
jgi:uncharacterized protein (DUF2345 family)